MTHSHRLPPPWHQQPLAPAQPLKECPECKGMGSWSEPEIYHGWREREVIIECDRCDGSGWEPEDEEVVPPIREGGPFDGRYIPPSDADGFSLHNPGASLPARPARAGGAPPQNAHESRLRQDNKQ